MSLAFYCGFRGYIFFQLAYGARVDERKSVKKYRAVPAKLSSVVLSCTKYLRAWNRLTI